MDRLVVLIPDERNVATALLQKLRPHSTFTVDDYSLPASKHLADLEIEGIELPSIDSADLFDLAIGNENIALASSFGGVHFCVLYQYQHERT